MLFPGCLYPSWLCIFFLPFFCVFSHNKHRAAHVLSCTNNTKEWFEKEANRISEMCYHTTSHPALCPTLALFTSWNIGLAFLTDKTLFAVFRWMASIHCGMAANMVFDFALRDTNGVLHILTVSPNCFRTISLTSTITRPFRIYLPKKVLHLSLAIELFWWVFFSSLCTLVHLSCIFPLRAVFGVPLTINGIANAMCASL